jgi:hypothetical protein
VFAYVCVDLGEGAASVRKSAEWIDARPASFYKSKYQGIAAGTTWLAVRIVACGSHWIFWRT